MKDKALKIVFMGTPSFAVPSLQKIVNSKHQVVAVITAPDKPAGRGLKLQTTAVKDFALSQQIPILQPHRLKDPEFLRELAELEADLFVIVAFRMLPQVVWAMPKLGSINLHGSLLPKYRGAAPINWAVINGETETGVTTFFLKQEIDTGNIILQRKMEITESETAGEVHDRMMILGAETLIETVEQIASGSTTERAQEYSIELPIAPKISKETGFLQWSKGTWALYNLIRGLQPSPAAYTLMDQKILKIHKAAVHISAHNYPVGFLQTDHKSYIHVYSTDGFLAIEELQIEGKKRMTVSEFLRGNTLKDSIILPS